MSHLPLDELELDVVEDWLFVVIVELLFKLLLTFDIKFKELVPKKNVFCLIF